MSALMPRLLVLTMLITTFGLGAADDAPAYPLWDGQETVAEYAERANLPASKTLDLGNGVPLELTLIPAGTFVMGTPIPTPVGGDVFRGEIVLAKSLLAMSLSVIGVMVLSVAVLAIQQRQRPRVSLARFMLLSILTGVALMAYMHWEHAVDAYSRAQKEYDAATARYQGAEPDEKPGRQVTLPVPFYMGKYLVTQRQYEQVTGSNPSSQVDDDYPVEMVSWHDAVAFCQNVSSPTVTARLPTEAEWEYACRAGTVTAYYSGDSEADLARVSAYRRGAMNVGQMAPNKFGLYDMHAYVWQWCEDAFVTAIRPVRGPVGDDRHAVRGGDSSCDPKLARCAARNWTDEERDSVGFRVVVPVGAR